MTSHWKGVFAAALLLALPGAAAAEEIKVAVASSFKRPVQVIALGFERRTGHTVTIVSGATGKLYSQIKNGAPFDAFLAADTDRPQRLAREGLVAAGEPFTYAMGRLVLWSSRDGFVDDGGVVLTQGEFDRLAVANPNTAPYGRAAREVLDAMGMWETVQASIVTGQNVGQTYQFIKTGNADLGFVAYSQVLRRGSAVPGSYWQVPPAFHEPIAQQAVLLSDSEAARSFLGFLRTETVRQVIREYGFEVPELAR